MIGITDTDNRFVGIIEASDNNFTHRIIVLTVQALGSTATITDYISDSPPAILTLPADVLVQAAKQIERTLRRAEKANSDRAQSRPLDTRVHDTALGTGDPFFGEVLDERARQDAEWGGAAHDDHHTFSEWQGIIERYVSGGFHKPPLSDLDPDEFGERMIQLAALAKAAYESNVRQQLQFARDAIRSDDDPPVGMDWMGHEGD